MNKIILWNIISFILKHCHFSYLQSKSNILNDMIAKMKLVEKFVVFVPDWHHFYEICLSFLQPYHSKYYFRTVNTKNDNVLI